MTAPPETWFHLDDPPGEPAWNMALDEVLLERAGTLGSPILRCYGWTEPAATFGYFQRHREISALTSLRPLIRRPTGGGLVPHENDWTYSLAVPPGHPWHRLRAAESYLRLHTWLRDALNRLGIPASLAPQAQTHGPGQCFVGAEQHDLLLNGRKIAGAAQRRNRLGLLIQGSVQPAPADMAQATFLRAMTDSATAAWGVTWEPFRAPATRLARAEELVQKKYSQPGYNERR
jgi:lipoate-protein ligase A